MEAYSKKLTNNQKLAIESERSRLKEIDETRAKKLELKARLTALGKPKKPMPAFFLFHVDELQKSKTNPVNSKAKYDALSDTLKSDYKQKAAVLHDEYK